MFLALFCQRMRHFLAYVFLIIFSFQVLPVKEIGKILFKAQMTEEIHEAGHSSDDGPSAKLKKDSDFFKLMEHENIAIMQYIAATVNTAIHLSDRLPRQHVPDILTPPPNCI